MVFIAGVFPVGIYFATVATERTVAAVAADEAFAKIRIYAIGDLNDVSDNIQVNNLNYNNLMDFNDTSIFPATKDINANELAYPSYTTDVTQKQYFWSALCRITERYNSTLNPNPPVQVTVFVCRKVSPNLEYLKPPNGGGTVNWPAPVKVGVFGTSKNELQISGGPETYTYINDNSTIVDDATGRIYRVRERYRDDPATAVREDSVILLDSNWDDMGGTNPPNYVWVVPPPVTGTPPFAHGRYPCIAVYQKVIQF
jgi:hypothetical protein